MKPIIFSPDMVRAILEGRKTQTRRVQAGRQRFFPGDNLFVREKWRVVNWMDEYAFRVQYSTGEISRWIDVEDEEGFIPSWATRLWQEASEDLEKARFPMKEDGIHFMDGPLEERPTRWHSPRFMPLVFSRLVLRVTEVRVERLLSISEEDAKREGFESRADFLAYWDSLNAKRGGETAKNPEVQVISFRVRQKRGGKENVG